MDFVIDLVKEVAIIFFTTLAAGLGTYLISNLNRDKRKAASRSAKRKRGGRSK